jgi:hypothetical protein
MRIIHTTSRNLFLDLSATGAKRNKHPRGCYEHIADWKQKTNEIAV